MKASKRELAFAERYFHEVRHTTLNPGGPGVVRIHLIPPKLTGNEIEPSVAIITGMDMIPVDLGSLRGCETLPDKKRAIYSVLRAATGPIDKGTSRKLKGFLSDYLKDKEYSVFLKSLCSELEYAGDFGAEIADRVEIDETLVI